MRQRTYTLDVGPEGRVAIEAEGRALADMRLWRPGGELVDLAFERRNVEPKPGQFMTLIRLEGALAPGHYLVTAYGGEPLVWASGATAQPFLVRLENWTSLDAGLFEGVIGPFGSLRFAAPAGYDAFRLEAPQPAPVRLQAVRGASLARSGAIGKNSRDTFVTLDLASDGEEPAKLEVSGYEGQAFSLRAVRRDAHFSFEGSGPHLVGLDIAGEGGDEIAATALFARVEKDGKTRVVASDMPRLANGRTLARQVQLARTHDAAVRGFGRRPGRRRRQGRQAGGDDRADFWRAGAARRRQRFQTATIWRRAFIRSCWTRSATPPELST